MSCRSASPRARRAIGLGYGLALFTLIVAVAALFGVYRIEGYGGTGGLLPAVIANSLFPAVSEEILFRGIVFRWVERFAGTWAGLIVSSALFGAAHFANPAATWTSTIFIAVEAGVLLGGVYMLTRNLWLPIGLHAAWNFTQGGIFGVPVSGLPDHGLIDSTLRGPEILSGGPFGLEASIIALIVAGAAGLWFVLRSSSRRTRSSGQCGSRIVAGSRRAKHEQISLSIAAALAGCCARCQPGRSGAARPCRPQRRSGHDPRASVLPGVGGACRPRKRDPGRGDCRGLCRLALRAIWPDARRRAERRSSRRYAIPAPAEPAPMASPQMPTGTNASAFSRGPIPPRVIC